MKLRLVSLDTLKRIFADNGPASPVVMQRTCNECGCDVKIELHRTSGGFGLQGGILLERDQQIVADCLHCYEKHTVELV